MTEGRGKVLKRMKFECLNFRLTSGTGKNGEKVKMVTDTQEGE